MQKPVRRSSFVGLLVFLVSLNLLFAAQLPTPWGLFTSLALIVFAAFVVYKELQAVLRKS
jgi:membrane protein implicated in regulation of membrane protease activity